MTPQEFLKKWEEPAARGLKVLPESLMMERDLLKVLRGANASLENIIDKQAEDLRCFEGYIGNLDETRTPFVSRERGAELRNGKTHVHGIVPPYDRESSKTYPLYTPDSPLNERSGTEEEFKEIGQDNWRFFGDYDSPSI